MKLCPKCQRPMSTDEFGWKCDPCDDIAIDRYNRQREWDHYHPGEPMPKSER